jgi:site-specific DNA recombinase
MSTRVGAYARISEDDAGQALGVGRQEKDDRAVASVRGWEVVKVYTDNDLSAFKTNVVRPAFEEMLADLEAGRIDGIVAYDLDRFARQPVDLERAIRIYDARPSAVFASVQGDINLQTADGRTMARVMVAFANKASMDTSRRVSRKHLELAQAGLPAGGKRPFGWRDNRLTLHPRESRELRDAAARLLAGEPLAGIVRDWNARGIRTTVGNPWRVTSLRRVLVSPRIAGWRPYKDGIAVDDAGQQVRGTWEPVLDDETYEALRERLTPSTSLVDGKPRPGSRRFLLSGLARCSECSGRLYGTRIGRSGRHTYKCSPSNLGCGKVGVAGLHLEAEVLRQVFTVAPRRIRGQRTWDGSAELDAINEKITETQAAYKAGALSGADAFPMLAALRDELEALRIEERAWAESEQASADAARPLADRWDELSLAEQQLEISRLVRSVVVMPATQRRTSKFDAGRVQVIPA